MIKTPQRALRGKGRRKHWGHRNGLLRWGLAMGLGLSVLTALPSMANAHGPTIKLSRNEMKPGRLNLFVGTTVHFVNTVEAAGQVVVDDSGTVESPSIEATGEGWHFTFESEGRYELHLRDHPGAKATIVVIPKPLPPGHQPRSVRPDL